MPLYPPSSSVTTTRPRAPIAALNRPQISIYPRDLNQGLYTSTGAQLGALVVDGGTALHRQRTFAGVGIADVSLVFGNFANYGAGEVATTATITVSATLEYPAGTFYTVTVAGQSTFTISPGQTLVTDPIPIIIPANTLFYTRTFATVPAPAQVSPGIAIGIWGGSFTYSLDATACGDNYPGRSGVSGPATNKTTTVGQSWLVQNNQSYGPFGVIGTPLNLAASQPLVAIVGDSIVSGGYGDLNDGGPFSRAFTTSSVLNWKVARATESGANWSPILGRQNRMARVAACSTVVYEYGVNDIFGLGSSFAALRTNVLAGMLACGGSGATVWATTITPYTTSTDGWTTAVNQTAKSSTGNTTRLTYNTYVRAAASAGAGNSLAYDLAAQGTLFGGYIDVAQATETVAANTAPVSGVVIAGADRWYVAGGIAPTADGLHPTQTVNVNVLAPIIPVASFT